MLNIEKYKDEILKQVKSGNTFFCAIGNVSDINTCHYCEICDKKCEEKMFNWLLEEYKEPILTEEEKTYLSAVIKPFRKFVVFLEKLESKEGWEKIAFYSLNLKSWECMTILPPFQSGARFKGMELNKQYKLEKLGL